MAQPAPDPSDALRFEIQSFRIEGNTLLDQVQIERLVAPFTGKRKDFADIQRALEALEVAYRNAGYGAVQVNLPEQNIASGVVIFRIHEHTLAKVTVDGAQRYREQNIRRSIPALREGSTPNSIEIARSLILANENPSRYATVLMRAGEKEGTVDATIKVTEDKPWRVGLTLDNTGNTATGDYRVHLSYQHANVFDRDHTLTLQYGTSPNKLSDVKVYGLGYRIPLYKAGGSLELVAGYSNVNSGNVQGLFDISGSGTVAGLRYNHILPKFGDYEQKVVLGLDYKAFKNEVLFNGQNQAPDVTVQPASVTYYGVLRGEGRELSFYLSQAQNFPGGNDGADSDLKISRFDAKGSYRVYRVGANYSRLFGEGWLARAQMSGQYSNDALIAGEQFGIGGAENVRGFPERVTSNDSGYRFNLEMHSPDIAPKFGWKEVQSRLLAFYDWGTVDRVSVQPGESRGESITSAGFGLRLNAGRGVSVRVDYAYVLDGGGTQDRGHKRVHGNISLSY